MYQRQLEDIASKRPAELRAMHEPARRGRSGRTPVKPRKPIRTQTGWALVSIGLRLAGSGNR
ncbi:MAG TPA: hypothetical protein VF843_04030 [Streptosporangiaceae bacterium]